MWFTFVALQPAAGPLSSQKLQFKHQSLFMVIVKEQRDLAFRTPFLELLLLVLSC